MRKAAKLLTRKFSERVDGTQQPHKVATILMEMRSAIAGHLSRFARGEVGLTEDAAGYGFALTWERLGSLATDAELPGADLHDRIFLFMQGASEGEMSRLRKASAHASLDKEIGREDADTSFTLASLLTSKKSSAAQIENYADAMKIARAADCMKGDERRTLIDLADGITAEVAAFEQRRTANDIRMDRRKMISRLQQIWGRV